MAAHRKTTRPRTRQRDAVRRRVDDAAPATAGPSRPLVRSSYRGLAPGDRQDGERDGQGGDRARDRQLGRDGQVLGPADPVGQRDSVGAQLAQETSSWTMTFSRCVRLDVDDARLVDGQLQGRGAGAVLELLLGVRVDVDLARLVGLDHELDLLAGLDLDPLAVGLHGVAREGDLDGLGLGGRCRPGRPTARRPRSRRAVRPRRSGSRAPRHMRRIVEVLLLVGRAPVGRSSLPESHVEQARRGLGPRSGRALRRKGHRDEPAAAAAGPGVPHRGDAVHADAQRDRRDLRAGRLRLHLRAARRADRATGSRSSLATGSGSGSCRAGWPTRSGSTTRTSTSPTTYAGPRCRARAASTSCASWWPGSSPARSTGTGRCGRSTSSRGSPTAGWRCSRSRTRRWSTASTPSTSARCCSTSSAEPRTLGHDEWRPPRDLRRRPAWCSTPSGTPGSSPASCSTPCAATPARCCAPPRPAGSRVGSVANALSNRRSPAGLADRGAAVPAAPVRGRAHRPRGRTARSGRRTAAPSTTSSSRPSPARCGPG